MDRSIAAGHYARKQIFSRSRLVAWSHGSRFARARQLVAPYAGQRLLDYGCGDGTFLALVHDLFPDALGVDVAPDQIAECSARFAGLTGLRFATTDDIAAAAHTGRYDVIVCTEVLEHCPSDIQNAVLDRLTSLLAARGVLIVSVPIEIGPALAAKQLARALAAGRGLEEYATRERYRPSEFFRMVFASRGTAIARVESIGQLGNGREVRCTGHKGFNWRALERSLGQRFVVVERHFTPMPRLGPWLNSQAWFVCRRR